MTESGSNTASIERRFIFDGDEAEPLLLGHSRAYGRLRAQIARRGGTEGPVLLIGEQGVGRSVIARSMHQLSSRARAPFVVVPCAVDEATLEADLFGCLDEMGSDACSRPGALDVARGGSVLLRDIDEMNTRLQGRLSEFLKTGRIVPIGAAGSGTPVDVRLFASLTTGRSAGPSRTLLPLRAGLRGAFIGGELQVPPLRERRDDIPVLADYFARAAAERLGLRVTTFTPQAHSALEAYSWPGNVSELELVVERLVIEARGGEVRAEDLPVGIRPRLTLASRASSVRRSVAQALLARLVNGGESFWTSVYPLFMRREITRTDVRELIQRGSDLAGGRWDSLLELLGIPARDRGRFERFLRRYRCDGLPGLGLNLPLAPIDESDGPLPPGAPSGAAGFEGTS